MNYTRLLKADIANGPGFRLTLWVTGCMRKCPGCFNEEAQDPKFGQKFDEETKKKIFKELAEPTCDGLSLMGGEPLSKVSDNRKQIIQLCRECKERFPEKDIWVWSGYTFEEIAGDRSMNGILNYVDVIVDGAFVESKKDLSCPFRGSTNQRVIDVKKTMERKSIVEMRF
jgi:anaerobic ribonucleoside-triphosphate reductase activating protein